MHMRQLKKLRYDDDTCTLKIDGENGFEKSKTIYLDIKNTEIFLNTIKSAFHFDDVAIAATVVKRKSRTISTALQAVEQLCNHWPAQDRLFLSAASYRFESENTEWVAPLAHCITAQAAQGTHLSSDPGARRPDVETHGGSTQRSAVWGRTR